MTHSFDKENLNIENLEMYPSSKSKYDEYISKEQRRNQDLLEEIRKLKKYNDALISQPKSFNL